jgi:putative aldouronate transport system permease protein
MEKTQTSSFIQISKSKKLWKDIVADRYLYFMMIPGLLSVIIFSYVPMYGLVLAFKDFKIAKGVWGSSWIGLYHFKYLFTRPDATYIIFNTLRISVINLLINFPIPIILALLLNELKNLVFRRTVQSILYLPHFISWVVISGLLYGFFSTSVGLVNKIIVELGGQAINVVANPDNFRLVLYLTNAWKGAGWGTIIYLAAIVGIDQEMYEAAEIDGANRFQQMLKITLPAIQYSIIVLLVLNVGSIMGANFDQIMNLRSDPTIQVSQVIDTYVFDMGVSKLRYDFATAVGMFQQVINCILLVVTNKIAKKISGESFF